LLVYLGILSAVVKNKGANLRAKTKQV